MKHMEREGAAVAYALLIMNGMDVGATNERIIREHGRATLERVKRRAWEHVEANRAAEEER